MQTFVIVMIVVALFCGAADTFLFSVQNHHIVTEGGISKKFYHPYMQLAMRYVSNFAILIVYVIQLQLEGKLFGERQQAMELHQNQKQNKRQRNKLDYVLIIIPTILDYFANLGYYVALNFLLGSVYQMLRGGNLIATYLFSYTFLGTHFVKNRTIGCIIIIFGLLLIGIVNLIFSSGSQTDQNYTLLGYGLIIFSLIINAIHFIYEEYLAVNYQLQPFLIIGLEGVYGLIINFILIPIFSTIPCFFKQDACTINDQGTAVVQDFHVWLRQITSDPLLLFTVIMVFFTMAIYNAFGVAIAKYARSLTRSTIDVSRSVLIWIIGILFTATLGKNNSQYIFQSLGIQQLIGQIVGFIMVIIGNLIYYEIIKFECLQEEKSTSLIQEPYQ